MNRQDIIDELFELRTMQESCINTSGDIRDICHNCPVRDSCDKFFVTTPEHLVKVLDEAIEILREIKE